ncbi:hypothetical protein KFE25_007161 [Diacronema lutheri]|uniref:Uncharacterized protein n=3 Tax=Diacronema lutheri TaxID=2081491 RepID=A0A8J5XXH7_DIALT|nr:hypothetical protein KFE25_007161 [Diacronema lutheri]
MRDVLSALHVRVELAHREANECLCDVLHVRSRLDHVGAEIGVPVPPLDDEAAHLNARAPGAAPAVVLPPTVAPRALRRTDSSTSSFANSPRTPSPASSRPSVARAPRTPEPKRSSRDRATSPVREASPSSRCAVQPATVSAAIVAGARAPGAVTSADAPAPSAPESTPMSSSESDSDDSDAGALPAALQRSRLLARARAEPQMLPPILASWRARELERVLAKLSIGEEELAHALLTMGTAEHDEYARLSRTELALLAAVAPSAWELRAARAALDSLCSRLPAGGDERPSAREQLRALPRAERFVCALTRVPLARERLLCWAFAVSYAQNAAHVRSLVRRVARAARELLARRDWVHALLRLLLPVTPASPAGADDARRHGGAEALGLAAIDERAAALALDDGARAAVRTLCASVAAEPGGAGAALAALDELQAVVADGALAVRARERSGDASASPAADCAPAAEGACAGDALGELLARLDAGVVQLHRALRKYARSVLPDARHPDDAFVRVLRPFAARAHRETAQLAHELGAACALCADAAVELLGGRPPPMRLGSAHVLFRAIGAALSLARAVVGACESAPRVRWASLSPLHALGARSTPPSSGEGGGERANDLLSSGSSLGRDARACFSSPPVAQGDVLQS